MKPIQSLETLVALALCALVAVAVAQEPAPVPPEQGPPTLQGSTVAAPPPARPTSSAAAAAAATHRTAPFGAVEAAVQRRLASPEAMRVFRQYNAAPGRQIQDHLATIYAGEAEFGAEAGTGKRPLGDSIVGPVTLKWLVRFCRDYGIVASDPQFEHDVVRALEQVASIARKHPDWQKILFSPEFDAWIDGQPSPRRVLSLKMRRSGAAAQVNALIDQYLKEPPAAPAQAGSAAEPIDVTYAYDPARLVRRESLDLVVARLKPLAAREAQEEELFVEDVQAALAGLPLKADTLGLIKRLAEVDAYMVRPETLLALRRQGMPGLAADALREQMGGIAFEDTQSFFDALAVVAEAHEPAGEFDRWKRPLVRAARLPRYRIPESLAADLAADAPLEPALAMLFAGIAHVEYPNRTLFDRALRAQVGRALGMCPDPKRGSAGARGLDDQQFAAVAALMPEHAAVFDRIAAIRAAGTGCDAAQSVEADALSHRAFLHLVPRLERKIALQRTHVVARGKPRGTAWARPGCACGRPANDGLVYGFYPLWMSAGESQIDFGQLSRIGLYGVSADDRGELLAPHGMNADSVPDGLAELMREAHRHKVSVDWVVARSDWTAWKQANRPGRKAVLDNLRDNIIRHLARPLRNGGQELVRLASLGSDRGAAGGDGIALYFRGFPAADKDLFNDFLVQLSRQMRNMEPVRLLSVVVDYEDFGVPGAFGHGNLANLLQRTNPVDSRISFASSKGQLQKDMPILVMMTEPTHETKMHLRGGVQEALDGTDSQRLLRSLVPVFVYDGVRSEQLADDIVYTSDNYFGIGFWTLPFASLADSVGTSASDARTVNRLLDLYYEPDDDAPALWQRYLSLLCPHRLWIRWVAWLTLVVALAVGSFYFRCKGCNERLDKNGFYLMAMSTLMGLPLFALLVLVMCDPVLEPYAPVLLGAYGLGGMLLAALVVRHYFNKSRRKVP